MGSEHLRPAGSGIGYFFSVAFFFAGFFMVDPPWEFGCGDQGSSTNGAKNMPTTPMNVWNADPTMVLADPPHIGGTNL